MKLALKFLFLFVFSFSANLFAQDDEDITPGQPNELDNLFVPGKSSVFNSDGETKSARNSGSSVETKNAIKYNFAMLPRSIALFSYERRFTDMFSIEAGLGLCYAKDRIFTLLSGFSDEFSNDQGDLSLSTIMTEGTYNKKSFYSSITFRFSWESYYDYNFAPYFAINARTYSQNMIMKASSSSNSTYAGNAEVKVKNTCINLLYGFQYFTEGRLQTVHDFYFGLGMRSSSFDKFSSQYVNSSYQNYNIYTKTSDRASGLAPSFIAGYVFGFGF